MPAITNANIRALAQRLAQDGAVDKKDVDALVDAAMQDSTLTGAERAELREVLKGFADKMDSAETKQRLKSFLAIQNGGIRELAHTLERDDGVIDAGDAAKIADLVNKDGRVSGRERYSLAAVMVGARMTDEARAALKATAGEARPDNPTPGRLVDLGLPEVDGKKFQLSSEGFLTAGGPARYDEAGAYEVYQGADALTRADGAALKGVPADVQAKLLSHLEKAFDAGKETSPLPEVSKLHMRSGAAATLIALIEGAEGDLKQKAVDLAFQQAFAEPMHGIRASLFFNLERIKDQLSPADQAKLGELEKAVIPQKPPYEKWFEDGKREINVKHYAHHECWIHGGDPIRDYQNDGFKVVSTFENEEPKRWILEKDNPDAPGGNVKMRVEIVQSHDGIFQSMDDPDVNMIFYTGHSNLGGNVSEELRLGTEEKSEKVILLAMCRGKQNMFEVANKYPNSHFVTTDKPSYFSSVIPVALGMANGALRLDDYGGMKEKTRRIWDEGGNKNYFYPDEPRRYALYDLDKDGVIDSRGAHVDRLYDVALKKPDANRLDGVPRATSVSAEELDGTNVLHAVQFLNTLMTYHVDHGHHTSAFKSSDMDNFLSAGWFDGPLDEKVRLEKTPDGKVEVRVNKALAEQSWAVLGTLVQYEVVKQLLAERNGGTLTKKDEARAMLFAGEYLAYMYCSLDEAQAGIRAISRDSEHLPGTSFNDLYQAIDADGHGYVTDKQVEALVGQG